MKKVFLSLITVFMVLSLSVVLVKASEATTVELNNKVSVRTDSNVGIMWEATVTNPAEGQTYGFLFAQGQVADLNKDTVDVYNVELDELLDGNKFRATMVKFPKLAVAQDISVRAYVKNGDEYLYSEYIDVRNLAETTVKAKYAGIDGEGIDNVIKFVQQNYMVTYKVGDNVYLQKPVYEYEPTELAKVFINDWNEVLGEAINTMSGFGKLYMGSYADSGTKAQIEGNKLYIFFNANDGEMLAKWGWLLDYIVEKASNDFSNTQVKLINGEIELQDANAKWWGARHLLARIENFFTRQDGAGTAFNSNKFTTKNQYPDLVETLDALEEKFISNVDYEYIKVGAELQFVDPVIPNGYAWAGYNLGENYYGSTVPYEVTADYCVFVPTTHEIQYTITYKYNNETLTDVEPTNFTINTDTFDLPSYQNEEFELEGWYDNPEFSGEPITSIEKGTYKDYVLYAKPKTNVDVEVVYDLNGGYITVENFETTNYVAGAYNAINWTTYVNYLSILTTRRTYWYHIGLTATEIPGLYITGENAADSKITGAYDLYIAYCDDHKVSIPEVFNFVKSIKENQLVYVDNIPAAATSSASINIKFLDSDVTLEKYNQVEFVYNTSTELLIPARENYTFLGWEDASGNIVTEFPGYKENPGTIVYKAQWKSNGYKVTFNTNGGFWGYGSKEELAADFLGDAGKILGIELATLSDYHTNGSKSSVWKTSNVEFRSKWLWLLEYIKQVTASQSGDTQYIESTIAGTSLSSYATQNIILALLGTNYATATAAVDAGGYGITGFSSKWTCADFSSQMDGFWSQYKVPESEYTPENELPVVYKAGYTFAGWYSTADFQEGSLVTNVTSVCTLYAKWIAE